MVKEIGFEKIWYAFEKVITILWAIWTYRNNVLKVLNVILL